MSSVYSRDPWFIHNLVSVILSGTSARKKYALGKANVCPDAENPPGTPQAPGTSRYLLHRTVDAWCVQIMGA